MARYFFFKEKREILKLCTQFSDCYFFKNLKKSNYSPFGGPYTWQQTVATRTHANDQHREDAIQKVLSKL